ncbi:MAG: hypothetical protein JNK65_09600 [Deltaproteobacteria bacterium]|nr:hypothetical protein [Deltaproteobacteria bacterium]
MSSLSIRHLPEEIEKALIREAKRLKTTKTEIVLHALKEKFHLTTSLQKQKKIRNFFGKMNSKQFESFRKATHPFSKIEKDLWK